MTVTFAMQVPKMPEGWQPGDPIPMDMSVPAAPARQPEGPGLEGETAFLKQQPSSSEDSEGAPQDDPDGAPLGASLPWQHRLCSKKSLEVVFVLLAFPCHGCVSIQSDQVCDGWQSRPTLGSLPSLTRSWCLSCMWLTFHGQGTSRAGKQALPVN